MKKLFLFLIVTCAIYSTNAQKIIRATVISVPLSMTTTFDESCDAFPHNFKEVKKTKEIKTADVGRLLKLLHHSLTKSSNLIDVRGQLLLYFENKKTKTLCFDQFGQFTDGAKYFDNKPLFQFLVKNKLITY